MRTLYKYIQMTWIGVIINQHYESFMVNPWLVKIKVPWNKDQNGHIQWINTKITRCFRWISGEKKVDILPMNFTGILGGNPTVRSNSLPWNPCHIIPVDHRGSIIYGENGQFSMAIMAMLVVFRQPRPEKWWSESQLGPDDIPNMTGKS